MLKFTTKVGMALIWLALFDAFFIILFADANEIFNLAMAGIASSIVGLALMFAGERKTR